MREGTDSVRREGWAVPEMRRVHRIHFIGVGGAGMSGIAEVLQNQGYAVSGSDLAASAATARLEGLGVRVHLGHDADQVRDADVVVVSSAVPEDNPERVEAVSRRIPVVPRAEMLGELMRYRHGVAVAGTHGKTTTTSLVTAILSRAGLDPTYVIGGLVRGTGASAALGRGSVIVVEADESDGSFLYLKPMSAVLTNIDDDHLGHYGGDIGNLERTFAEFLRRLPFYGRAVLCIDDPRVRALLPEVHRPVLTYGTVEDAAFRAVDLRVEDGTYTFTAVRPERPELSVRLGIPGRHNVLNALAAIAVAQDEGVEDEAIEAALADFRGVGRRFERSARRTPDGRAFELVDDYGHHPTEVDRVIDTARELWPERRLVMLYQPHRYTRTRDLYDDFVRVLPRVDLLLLLPVYGAGEPVIAGADSRALARGIRQLGAGDPVLLEDQERAVVDVLRLLEEGDVLLTQGAGDVGRLAVRITEETRPCPA